MKLRNKNWHLLDIPEGKQGAYSIQHRFEAEGLVEGLANARCVAIGGQSSGSIEFDYPTRWHSLMDENGIWMTDRPCEQVQHDSALEPLSGTVLVGGLGLGYVVTKLASMPTVRSILVVERSQEVIDLVWPHVEHCNIATVVCADLFEYLREAATKEDPPQFDWAFFDIWRSDGERTLFETVVPLRQLVAGSGAFAYSHQVVCWNEDVMRGQLVFGLLGTLARLRADSGPGGSATLTPLVDAFLSQLSNMAAREGAVPWVSWRVPFFEALRERAWSPEDDFEVVQCYSACWGSPGWQNVWNPFLDELLNRHLTSPT